MNSKKQKIIFVGLTIISIGLLLYALFSTDIIVIGNQLETDTGLIKEQPISAFAGEDLQKGSVEYLPVDSPQEPVYPSLPSVHAKLVIPRINIEGYIVDGKDEKALDLGFWHFPSASPFSSKGNVVIIGHRYLKLPPNRDTFYHLDWVKVGDDVYIKTDTKSFAYHVTTVEVVTTADTYVLQQTENAQLTLITCHPLWTSLERLVIIAQRQESKTN